jgi:mevalonate kinase
LSDHVFGYAPGKVILLGEHAVVYGQPAIAAPLDRGIRVVVSERASSDQGEDVRGPTLKGRALDGASFSGRPDPKGDGPAAMREALDKVVELFGEGARDLALTAEGNIPAGAGLGSSAALSVALVRALHQWFDTPAPEQTVLEQAYLIEKVFHGNPSGVDHTTIASGALTWFQRTEAGTVTEQIELARPLHLAIGLAGPHAGTAHAVAALADRRRRHPEAYAHLFDGLGALTREARSCLESGRLGALGELWDVAQGYLNALGVSTPTIEALCAIARDSGALGAKLTGAGCGGAVIALVDDDPEPVLRAFTDAGYRSFRANIEPSAAEPAANVEPLRAAGES